MKRSLPLLGAAVAVAVLAAALTASAFAAPSSVRETHRIRIGNRKGGAVEISLDGGHDWTTVGRVLSPATETGPGFTALAAAPAGTVAAVSLEGITLRADRGPDSAGKGSRIFRLLPAGGIAGPSGMVTDLPRGRAVFGSLAPTLGAEVLLEGPAGSTSPLPGAYIPRVGDHLVIVATVPASAPAMLVFENHAGGRVLSVSPSGDEAVVGHVRQPLRGVGHYAAADGAVCGGVVAHHPAAVVVASAPAGTAGTEVGQGRTASGFLIQRAPSGTGAGPGAADLVSAEGSVLVVDRLTASGPAFGVPITLSPGPRELSSGTLAGETRVEARLDGGPWEPLPAAGGDAPAAYTAPALEKQFAALGTPRSLSEGVTHLRLVLAPPSPERLRAALAQVAVAGSAHVAAAPASSAATPRAGTVSKLTLPKGGAGAKSHASKPPRKATKTLRIVATIQGQGITFVMFYVDGRLRKVTNTPPFDWLWDTRTASNGTHTLEIRGADPNGRVLTTQTQHVAVYN